MSMDVSYEEMLDTLHSLDEETDVERLKQAVTKYGEYHETLTQRLRQQTFAGEVKNDLLDHLYVSTDLLTEAVGRLCNLGAVKIS